MTAFTATYSPDDNKLRLYATSRLDADTYARVKAAGFKWAPKQDLFVAPAWTPEREDLLLELAGEIDDDDTSLVDRAEQRAERFETYGDKRMTEAESARAAVARIADGIPLGQPILVGHHSERHARRDAQRIDHGMRKAVALWDTSKYWTSRADGAIRHAKYKELPAVRARRIKGLEAERRKHERAKADSEKWLRLWSREGLTLDHARTIANHCHLTVARIDDHRWSAWDVLRPDGERYSTCPAWTVEQVRDAAREAFPRMIAYCERWIAHIDNRLAYERTMQAECGGTVADRKGPEVGGGVRCWVGHRGAWSWVVKVNRVSVTVLDNWGNGGQNFTRTVPFDKLSAILSKDEVDEKRAAGMLRELDDKTGFVVLDAPPPTPRATTPATDEREVDGEAWRTLRDIAQAGVKVITAPQLFPTPRDIAARIIEVADIAPDMRVLEPSAGLGALLGPAKAAGALTTAVELVPRLCEQLRQTFDDVHQGDFLSYDVEALGGMFDRVVMNPPFEKGADVAHIKHALSMLAPGGRLVALCAAGPRQAAQLQPLAASWEELPGGSFAAQGTSVRVVLLTIQRA